MTGIDPTQIVSGSTTEAYLMAHRWTETRKCSLLINNSLQSRSVSGQLIARTLRSANWRRKRTRDRTTVDLRCGSHLLRTPHHTWVLRVLVPSCKGRRATHSRCLRGTSRHPWSIGGYNWHNGFLIGNTGHQLRLLRLHRLCIG